MLPLSRGRARNRTILFEQERHLSHVEYRVEWSRQLWLKLQTVQVDILRYTLPRNLKVTMLETHCYGKG